MPPNQERCGEGGCARSVGVQRISATLQRASIGGLSLCSPGHAPQESRLCSRVGTRRQGRSSGQKLLFYAGQKEDVSVAFGASLPFPRLGAAKRGRSGPRGLGVRALLPEAAPAPRDRLGGSAPRATGRGGLAVPPPRPSRPSRGAQRAEPRRPPLAHAGPGPQLAAPSPRGSHSPAARGVTALRHPGLRVRFREAGGLGLEPDNCFSPGSPPTSSLLAFSGRELRGAPATFRLDRLPEAAEAPGSRSLPLPAPLSLPSHPSIRYLSNLLIITCPLALLFISKSRLALSPAALPCAIPTLGL